MKIYPTSRADVNSGLDIPHGAWVWFAALEQWRTEVTTYKIISADGTLIAATRWANQAKRIAEHHIGSHIEKERVT